MSQGCGSVDDNMAHSDDKKLRETPLIKLTQKIAVYETKARFYIVGSNNTETKFRVLKIDRTEPKELVVTNDNVSYSPQEIRNLLHMIDVGNRSKSTASNAGLPRKASAFGIVGFVRFLEGYYIVLITKRRRVALLGHHYTYKIEDTTMIYIPNDSVRQPHPDETRYLKIFQNMDLSSNFYFSYSYDLTHTMQYNFTPSNNLSKSPGYNRQTTAKDKTNNSSKAHQNETTTKSKSTSNLDSKGISEEVEGAAKTLGKQVGNDRSGRVPDDTCTSSDPVEIAGREETEEKQEPNIIGTAYQPARKYVWNNHMLEQVDSNLHPDWLLYIIHGFIWQSRICVYGRSLFLTIIARRSNQFAGTRFLKRGANDQGYVANEVETEQIVNDASVMSFNHGSFTSFVQLRGSIPSYWSQDITTMVPKPPIVVDQADPYNSAAGQHFNDVLGRYGSPVIIVNLVKKREKRKHESLLSTEFVSSLQYLNQFLPPQHNILYIGFDMARVNKSKSSNVMNRLAEIAEQCVKRTGFFRSKPSLSCNESTPHERWQGIDGIKTETGWLQRGIIRTNCVDCLDRTNTAQFAVGKCALAYQLYGLGVIASPELEFDTDCVRMLEELYEDQGDTLALQYGGSQLVHRIQTYRKTSPWTSNSRDIMQTLSRYYSNAFSDSDKQHAINLFLGVFEPSETGPNIWELPTDFYLHNKSTIDPLWNNLKSYCQWLNPSVYRSLPLSYDEVSKTPEHNVTCSTQSEIIDSFAEYYKPNELTCLDELFVVNMSNSVRDFMPKVTSPTDYSPFCVRVRPGRRHEESGEGVQLNPNISGKDSTMSVGSQASEGTSSSSSDGSDIDGDISLFDSEYVQTAETPAGYLSLKDIFPRMQDTYGVEPEIPTHHNLSVYSRYTKLGRDATKPIEPQAGQVTDLIQTSMFSLDSSYNVTPPTVKRKSRDEYTEYVQKATFDAKLPSKRNIQLYHQYIRLNK
ncbi:unnamed protein product [Owenia fusiformis]|uniref:Uncharacterized protein n=1 Tax=Owenia fusiformis TaxID=6347 RepID=A0A8J1UK97_OWEFU|nr:unnamed protein product [Owenia fusiformis]